MCVTVDVFEKWEFQICFVHRVLCHMPDKLYIRDSGIRMSLKLLPCGRTSFFQATVLIFLAIVSYEGGHELIGSLLERPDFFTEAPHLHFVCQLPNAIVLCFFPTM